jgi:hypothetical protein
MSGPLSDYERRTLAQAFDDLNRPKNANRQEHVIAPHQQNPAAFSWFVAGFEYARSLMVT